MTTRSPAPPIATAAPATRVVQTGAVLSALALLFQFATAGQLLSGSDVLSAHGAGAVGLHVATGVLLAGTVLHARATGVRWPAVVAAVTFLATFVQAALGSAAVMSAHVPGALAVTGGVVWLVVWAFLRRPGR
jgi:hypothetical protein